MNELDVNVLNFYPSTYDMESNDEFQKIPISELSTLGMIGSDFIAQIKQIKSKVNVEGIYQVSIPKGCHLANFTDSKDKIGMVMNSDNHLVGQAHLKELQNVGIPFNASMAFATVMLYNIDHKLDSIQKTQEEMISTINTKEHGDVKGNIRFLYDIVSDLKLYYSDETHKKEYRLKVQDIIQDAYKDMEKYKERLLKPKKKGIHFDVDVNKEVKRMMDDLTYYRYSVFMFCYAHYVELLLKDNLNDQMIEHELNRIQNMQTEYEDVYEKVYAYIKESKTSAIEHKGVELLGQVSVNVGYTLNKVPVLDKVPVDEALVKIGENTKKKANERLNNSMNRIDACKSFNVNDFVQQYEKMKECLEPANICFDNENVYIEKRLLA